MEVLSSIQSHPTMRLCEIGTFVFDVDFAVLKEFCDVRRQQQQNEGADGGEGDGQNTTLPRFIFSPKLTLGRAVECESTWQLLINPFYLDEQGKHYISCLLSMSELKNELCDHIDVIYSIRLFDNMEQVYGKESSTRTFTRTENLFGWDKFLLFEKLGSHPPPVIRFGLRVKALTDNFPEEVTMKYVALNFAPDISNLFIPIDCCLDNEADEHEDFSKEQGKETTVTSSQKIPEDTRRKKHMYMIWNKGCPKLTDTSVICKNGGKTTVFPVHSDVISEESQVFASHFAQTDSFAPEPFMSEIDPELMELVIQYCYIGRYEKELKIPKWNAKAQDVKASILCSFINLWDAVLFLKVQELSDKICEEIMIFVKKETFTDLFSRYKLSVATFEDGKVATKQDFVGYLLKLKEKQPWSNMIFSDFRQNRLDYAKLLFK